MSYYEDYGDEPYYEPTPADEIFFEAKQKLEECLKESIKYKIGHLAEENARLKTENEKMQEKVRNIEWKEKSLENKEKDLERSVLRKKFSEMLKPLEEQTPMYNVDYTYIQDDKCNKCNNKRQIEFTLPSGKKSHEDCSCNKSYIVYYPILRKMITLALYKDRNYPYAVSVSPKYDSASYDDTYCKFELKQYIKNIDEETDVDVSKLNYTQVGFQREKDCQKLCDYLNTKERLPKKIIAKAKARISTDNEDDDDSWD
jgi:regulator of replication initiation timing